MKNQISKKGRPVVQLISIPWLVDKRRQIERLVEIIDVPSNTQDSTYVYFYALMAKGAVKQLLEESIYSDLVKSCRIAGVDFISEVDSIERDGENAFDIDRNKELSLRQHCDTFLKVLDAELQGLPFFIVNRKDSFDSDSLIRFPDRLFPSSLLEKFEDVSQDVVATGRCIAFELPTAAGFHLFRILETVFRKYYLHVSQTKLPKNPNLGVLLNNLKTQGKGCEKILGAVTILKDLYRNPLAHPEVNLTIEEAIGIYGQVRSALSAILSELPDAERN